MTRKKKLVLGGALLTIFVAAGGAAAWFMGASILSHLPFVGQPESSVEAQSDQHQGETNQEAQPSPSAEEVVPEVEGGHADAKAEIANDEHGGAAKSGDKAAVQLIPAPDFVSPQSRSSSIVKAVRDMNTIQTRMAKGEKDAPQALKSAMSQVRDLIAKLDVAQISGSEIQSVALYVLSGGDPLAIERLVNSKSLSSEQKSLLTGVISYATADVVKASELLIPLELKTFETTLSAQLSMAQAQLATGAPHSDNIKRLEYAANVTPGTLIEEAATRRLIPHLAGAGEVKTFSYWTQRYMRRFPESLYYRDFEVSLANAILAMLAGKSALNEQILADIFRAAGEKRTATMTREILIRSILQGSAAQCGLIEKSLESSFDLKLESLEASAALIRICKVTESGADELAALKSIDVSRLDEDLKLHLSKAIAMSKHIQNNSPFEDDGKAGPHLPISADEAYAPLFASVTQQMDASIAAIRRVDDDEADSDK